MSALRFLPLDRADRGCELTASTPVAVFALVQRRARPKNSQSARTVEALRLGGIKMQCPYCMIAYRSEAEYRWITGYQAGHPIREQNERTGYGYFFEFCPECDGAIMTLMEHTGPNAQPVFHDVWPKTWNRPRLPDTVPSAYANDFHEASDILGDSPKASAAMSRRCLQAILRDYANTRKRDLADQIDEVLPNLPSYIAEMIDAVRAVGNFGAHPIKSQHTGEIMDVEPGEAETTLEALRLAIDHYIIKPAETSKKRDAINAKLAEAGKPALK